MDEYVFGANILENLTTGMYKDSKIIYREYIQNACDQIDKAIKERILRPNEGKIQIWLDEQKRTICVEDNATGIKSLEFKRILGNIADSDKKVGEDKGFRGIGRLCGLAYCRELIFTSKYKGENVISIMRCDGRKMRELIDTNEHGEKITASEVLNKIFNFDNEETNDTQGHWFKVELIGINEENTDLLDFSQIKDYLSFVAPVPYQNTFIFRTEIYNFTKTISFIIDEYDIRLNGEQIFKQYKSDFCTSKGEDSIFDIAFKEFRDSNDNLLAWMWIGVSKFKAVISKEYQMRGLRLRKENIQIGNEDALQKLFKEDRGPHYFVGEVFAVSKDLIPNSQRDYFNENATRLDFERALKAYFLYDLKEVYYTGSTINSAIKKITNYEKEKAEHEKKINNGDYVDQDHINAGMAKLQRAKEKAEEGKKAIEKKKQKANKENNLLISSIIDRIETTSSSIDEVFSELSANKNVNHDKKISHRTDKLSSYSKKERKLISKILGIIVKATDEQTADILIKKIEDELR